MSTQKLDELGNICICVSNNHSEKRTYHRTRSFFVLGVLCLTLPILGGCAAAGLAAAFNNPTERTLVATQSSSSAFAATASAEVAPVAPDIEAAVTSSAGDSNAFTSVPTDPQNSERTISVSQTSTMVYIGSHYLSPPVEFQTASSQSGSLVLQFDAQGRSSSATLTNQFGTQVFSDSGDSFWSGSSSIPWGMSYSSPWDTTPGPIEITSLYITVYPYMVLGAWELESFDRLSDSGSRMLLDLSEGLIIGGSPTNSPPVSGTGSYSGVATIVNMITGSGSQGSSSGGIDWGTMQASIDFATRQGSLSVTGVGNFNFTSSVGITGANLDGSFTSQGGYDGSLTGSFYGPNAEQLGGTITYPSRGFGVFGGTR